MVEKAKEKGVKLLLPVDGLAATEFSADAEAHLVDGVDIPDGMMGMDIGPKTIPALLRRREGRGHRHLERPHGRV